jgi:hypothetical protein
MNERSEWDNPLFAFWWLWVAQPYGMLCRFRITTALATEQRIKTFFKFARPLIRIAFLQNCAQQFLKPHGTRDKDIIRCLLAVTRLITARSERVWRIFEQFGKIHRLHEQ